MTYSNLERRVTDAETWLTDIDYSYREAVYTLTRAGVRGRIERERMIDHANRMGRGIELIMRRLGVTECAIGEIAPASAGEVDALLEAEALHPFGRCCTVSPRPPEDAAPGGEHEP
ncbi:hypothetical protein [Nocardia wallacei]|uniref:hypothetical protein n=1 Tax=Nocardia wallacei TaxID=480035 RepID=UPI0024548281|nr:hypothetical protein [Nocardia wallacei]